MTVLPFNKLAGNYHMKFENELFIYMYIKVQFFGNYIFYEIKDTNT
jgi:hypothetical protein